MSRRLARRIAASGPLWFLLSLVVFALVAGLALASELDDGPGEPNVAATRSLTPTATAGAAATSTPTATASATATSTPTRTPLADRRSCDEIRGTKYRSFTEREWFLNHCVTPTATPGPTSAAWTYQPAPDASAQGQDWRALVCTYGWDCSWAMAVVACESGGDPNAYNSAGPYVGLFQILDPSLSLFDPATNIAEAYYKYQTQGVGAWGCP